MRSGRWARGLAALSTALLLSGCVSALNLDAPRNHDWGSGAVPPRDASFSVMTLNIAHGRGNGFHQTLQNGRTAVENLQRIAEFLEDTAPDVVALQEADAASAWSGGFDHVIWLAREAGYPYATHGHHAGGLGLQYGTALLSRLSKTERRSHTFPGGIVAPPKGYTMVTLKGPGGRPLDVVSVHLDPLARDRRVEQLATLAEHFTERKRPVIFMGDFNTEWEAGESELADFARRLDLTTWLADDPDIVTFPRTGRRLDWILVTPELEIVGSEVHDDVLSDHRAVSATLRLRERQARHTGT